MKTKHKINTAVKYESSKCIWIITKVTIDIIYSWHENLEIQM